MYRAPAQRRFWRFRRSIGAVNITRGIAHNMRHDAASGSAYKQQRHITYLIAQNNGNMYVWRRRAYARLYEDDDIRRTSVFGADISNDARASRALCIWRASAMTA